MSTLVQLFVPESLVGTKTRWTITITYNKIFFNSQPQMLTGQGIKFKIPFVGSGVEENAHGLQLNNTKMRELTDKESQVGLWLA
jgi:hypothetical protein